MAAAPGHDGPRQQRAAGLNSGFKCMPWLLVSSLHGGLTEHAALPSGPRCCRACSGEHRGVYSRGGARGSIRRQGARGGDDAGPEEVRKNWRSRRSRRSSRCRGWSSGHLDYNSCYPEGGASSSGRHCCACSPQGAPPRVPSSSHRLLGSPECETQIHERSSALTREQQRVVVSGGGLAVCCPSAALRHGPVACAAR